MDYIIKLHGGIVTNTQYLKEFEISTDKTSYEFTTSYEEDDLDIFDDLELAQHVARTINYLMGDDGVRLSVIQYGEL